MNERIRKQSEEIARQIMTIMIMILLIFGIWKIVLSPLIAVSEISNTMSSIDDHLLRIARTLEKEEKMNVGKVIVYKTIDQAKEQVGQAQEVQIYED